MSVTKGLAIQEIAQDLHLGRYGGIRKVSSVKKAIRYGEEAASRYMDRARQQSEAAKMIEEEIR
jgi:hypothetical protein